MNSIIPLQSINTLKYNYHPPTKCACHITIQVCENGYSQVNSLVTRIIYEKLYMYFITST